MYIHFVIIIHKVLYIHFIKYFMIISNIFKINRNDKNIECKLQDN